MPKKCTENAQVGHRPFVQIRNALGGTKAGPKRGSGLLKKRDTPFLETGTAGPEKVKEPANDGSQVAPVARKVPTTLPPKWTTGRILGLWQRKPRPKVGW